MDVFRRIVVLTGAGISKDSGLDTFRDVDGLWSKVDLEDVATPQAFARNPKLVQDLHNDLRRRMRAPEIAPNAAHKALAELERNFTGQVLVVTQNVDDLHERAGTTRLIHMHGEMFKVRCLICGGTARHEDDVRPEFACPHCRAVGRLRPHVVWFGEFPFDMERIGDELALCDLFVSIGTSGNVYPAAGFVEDVKGRAHTVELNLEPSEGHSLFAEKIYGRATDVVPAFVARLLGRKA